MATEKLTAHILRTVLSRFDAGKSFLIAYSGGLDSHALLHLCVACKTIDPELKFSVAHVNHGLHADADYWEKHCSEVCQSLGLSLTRLRVDASPGTGQSPEEAARIARYSALSSLVTDNTVLLTAQHLDDQAETVILQMLRGSGLSGLSGMAQSTSFGQGLLFRPFLACPRVALSDYATANQLHWIEDPSNIDESYARNYLRQRIMPLLRQRWPAASKTIARSGQHCAEANLIQNLFIDEKLDLKNRAVSKCLQISELQGLARPVQVAVLRRWIGDHGCRNPPHKIMDRIMQEMLPAATDKNPYVTWGETDLRRYRGAFYLMPKLQDFDSTQVLNWDGVDPLELPCGNGWLSVDHGAGIGISGSAWQNGQIRIQFYRGGEICSLPGRSTRQRLKKLFQQHTVPPWVRRRMPLIYIDGELAAVGDLCVCRPFDELGAAGVRLHWQGYDLAWKTTGATANRMTGRFSNE